MAHKPKRTREDKRRIVVAYLDGTSTQGELEQAYGVGEGSIKRWMAELGITRSAKGMVAA